MPSVRHPWFLISDTENIETLTKAFVVAGTITADPGLSATTEISALRRRLRRLLDSERSRVIVWDYPVATSKIGIALSANELAELFDEATAERDTPHGPWSAALRLEVPVSLAARTKVGGIYGLSPHHVYSVLAIGAERRFPTGFPISVSFAAADPRRALSLDWPLRVGSHMPGVEDSWAAKHGYVSITDPDSTSEMVLMLNPVPHKEAEISIFAPPDFDIAVVGKNKWRELADMGAVVMPGFEPSAMTPWFDELTIALSDDRRFDVAVFEAWDKARRQPGVSPFGPPMLVAWHGAFDRARVSRLLAPTIHSLRSRPSNFYLSIPEDIAHLLHVPLTVSAPRLAVQLKRSVRRSFSDASKMLSVIRPQIYAGAKLPTASKTISADAPAYQQPEREGSSEKRHVNAWIDDGEPPLKRGRTYRIGINIGKLREKALASAGLPKVDWGGRKSLELLLVISGDGFFVKPREQTLSLPRHGDTKAVFFALTPVAPDSLLLRITLYLARELTLLEEFEIPIKVQDEALVA